MGSKKGTEITKSESATGVSIVIGRATYMPQGRPIAMRFEKETAHVYLVIDTSGSMADAKLEQAKKGILDFARDAFRKEYDVGLISFNSAPKRICKPTFDIELLKRSLAEMYASGSTNMSEAIALAREYFNSMKNTRVMVVATDGEPDNADEALNEAAKAKRDGIDIITVGTDDADQQFLKMLATRSELGTKVSKVVFSQAISSAANLLPAPKSVTKRKPQ